ncbi:MAG: insecticidal delta-endotoxin Cry8Ea1 family protein [Rickettsia endosymbiont of Pseudomimeciton antennatum]|nr:insecticidal delta-endotoxin Cry8Ea1 family protein [Rickettsia endosymbiont of Pseudomimeciton antennatum]
MTNSDNNSINTLIDHSTDKITTSTLTDQTDVINNIRATILYGFGEIPYVGNFLALLIGLFWPSSEESIWDEIKAQVERLIDTKIDEAIYALVNGFLIGLGDNLKAFLQTVKLGDPALMSQNFVACHNLFVNELPQFQLQINDTQKQLLPLFVQFANLHLALLRTGVLNADKMNWPKDVRMLYTNIITQTIKDYGDYTNKMYQEIQDEADICPISDPNYVAQFYFGNECRRKYQISVLDFSFLFPFYDPVNYPNKVDVKLPRVVYMGPIGSNYEAGVEVSVDIPRRTYTILPPTSFSLYSGGGQYDCGYAGGVVGYTVRYPGPHGPWGFQNCFEGRYQSDDGNIYVECQDSDHGPITSVNTWQHDPYPIRDGTMSTEFLYSLQLVHKDGYCEPLAGGCSDSRLPNTTFTLPNHILVDICLESYSENSGAVACILLGFQLENMGHNIDGESLMRAYYVHSINELSRSELLATFQQNVKMEQVIDTKLQEWQESRKAFWSDCESALHY